MYILFYGQRKNPVQPCLMKFQNVSIKLLLTFFATTIQQHSGHSCLTRTRCKEHGKFGNR